MPDFGPRINVTGGIKAQTKRGGFGSSWWGKRWIEVLESFDLGGRLERGRLYARKGQVLTLEISEGMVEATVQGSDVTPYDVSINVTTLTSAQWATVLDALSSQAVYTAKLLAGEMPPDIEALFNAANVPLFPAKKKDLKTKCSCPDTSNPCKHIAAVYYLIGEEFDRNPFLLLELRGMDRAKLEAKLGTHEDAPSEAALSETRPSPLPTDTGGFWSGGTVVPSFGDVNVPLAAASIVTRLGGVPFWRGSEPLINSMAPIYRSASLAALDVFAGNVAGATTNDDIENGDVGVQASRDENNASPPKGNRAARNASRQSRENAG